MALKMAKGSLFSVLLRSPWWYSVAIGLFLIALGLVFSDGKYLPFGVFSALPFFGIAGFAGYKQSQKPSQKKVIEADQLARKMTPAQIAEKIANTYVENRFESNPFEGSAADIELVRGHRKLLLSTKRFKAANTGIEPLKKLVADGEKYEATGYLYVSLGDISAVAIDYAKNNKIELVQASRLAEFFAGKAALE